MAAFVLFCIATAAFLLAAFHVGSVWLFDTTALGLLFTAAGLAVMAYTREPLLPRRP